MMLKFESWHVWLAINRSSAYWHKIPFLKFNSLNSFANTFPKRWKVSQKPWGSTVHVYWVVFWVLGFFHSKAKEYWNSGYRSTQKKASFKSSTVWYWASLCIQMSRMYEFGTIGWIGMTVSITTHKFHTQWYSPLGFLMGRIGILQEDRQDLISPCFKNLHSSGWIRCSASDLRGYYFFHGQYAPGFRPIFIGQSQDNSFLYWGVHLVLVLFRNVFVSNCDCSRVPISGFFVLVPFLIEFWSLPRKWSLQFYLISLYLTIN